MARLPKPGGDSGRWGDILNEFLLVQHYSDGTIKPIPKSKIAGLTNDLDGKLSSSNNLSDVTDASTARTNIGLGSDDNPQFSGANLNGDLNVGEANTTEARSINLLSSFEGGEDDGTGSDTTSRINLYSYQRASFYSFGENIRRYLMRKDAKSMDTWYFPDGGYDAGRNPIGTMKPVVWTGAHWESNNHNGNHKHWSVETPDSTGAIQTRFEVRWGDLGVDNAIAGLDKTLIMTNLADFVVRTTNNQQLRLSSNTSYDKDIMFSGDHEGSDAYRRWRLRVTSGTEDFQIGRFNNSGVLQDNPLTIARSTGKVTVTGAGLDVTRAGGTTLAVTQSTAGATAMNLFGADSAVRAFQMQVTGDSFGRLAMYTSGALEWGSGSGARDANLYRSAAGTLRTDNNFTVGTTLTVSNTLTMSDGAKIGLGTSTGTVIGTHASQKLAFWNATPIVQPIMSTGIGASVDDVILLLQTLGLCRQ